MIHNHGDTYCSRYLRLHTFKNTARRHPCSDMTVWLHGRYVLTGCVIGHTDLMAYPELANGCNRPHLTGVKVSELVLSILNVCRVAPLSTTWPSKGQTTMCTSVRAARATLLPSASGGIGFSFLPECTQMCIFLQFRLRNLTIFLVPWLGMPRHETV